MNPNINIYEYPTDPALLPEYRIAVMQAALDGAQVEAMHSHVWLLVRNGDRLWDWVNAKYRIKRPAIAKGNNPHNLTEDQVGVKDGWRLLTKEEILYQDRVNACADANHSIWGWAIGRQNWQQGRAGTCVLNTYRTKQPEGYFLPPVSKVPTTVMGWLLTLPHGYRVRAIRNMEQHKADYPASSMKRALDGGFIWAESQESHQFWSQVYKHYDGGDVPLPPIPEQPKPKKLVPWTSQTCPPLGTWFRNSDDGDSFYYWTLTAKDWSKMNWWSGEMLPFDDFRGVEYSTDQGKTWLPCGTEEEL